LISDTDCYAPSYACFQLDGVADVNIHHNIINYAKQFGVFLSSATSQVSYDVIADDNEFVTSTSSTNYFPSYIHWYDATGCVSCSIKHNKFKLTRKNDIADTSSATIDLVISGNQFYGGQDASCALGAGGQCDVSVHLTTGGLTTLVDNTWDHPAGQCLFSSSKVKAGFNDCHAPNQLNPPSGADYLNGAFDLGGANTSGSEMDHNSTDSTAVAAVSASSGSIYILSSFNQSGYTYASAFDVGTGYATSVAETSENAGGTTSTVPLIAAPTVGQATCVKSAGVIGYCSSVVGAGGACTCN